MAFAQHYRHEESRSFPDRDAGVHRGAILVNRSDQVAAVDVGYVLVAAAVGSVVADVVAVGSVAASLGAGTKGVVAAVVAASPVVAVAAAAVVVGLAAALEAAVV